MPSILLVEDDAANCQIWRRFLEREGYLVGTAADGRAALDLMEHLCPDLVITDLAMPNYGGAGLIRAIARRPALASVRVLIITGDASAQRPQGYDLLEKPFTFEALAASVRAILGRSAGTRGPTLANLLEAPDARYASQVASP